MVLGPRVPYCKPSPPCKSENSEVKFCMVNKLFILLDVYFIMKDKSWIIPAAFTRTFSIVIKLLNIIHQILEAYCIIVHLKKEAVCFQNIVYCFEYFLTMKKPLMYDAGITHVQPLSKVYILITKISLVPL